MSTVSEFTTLVHTGDIRIDSLLDSVSPWNFLLPYRNILYYTFDTSNGSYIDDHTATPVSRFNASQQAAVRSILDHASELTGIGFEEVTNSDVADIHFATTDLQGSTVTGFSNISYNYFHSSGKLISLEADGSIWLDNREFFSQNNFLTAGNQGYETLLHEIGHMLGLGHPFNDPNALPAHQNNTSNTVMSYTALGVPKSSFQPFDVWALTWIYGNDGLAGDWGYNSTNGFSLNPDVEDVTPPETSTIFPAAGSTGVAIDLSIEITFTEDIAAGSGIIGLKTEGGKAVATWNIPSSNAFSISGDTLILEVEQLDYDTRYILDVPGGAIKDLAGNSFGGIQNYDFTTRFEPLDIPLIDSGLSDIPEVAIQQIFVGLLGRPVKESGKDYWKTQVEEDNGFGLTELMANIVNEQPEYINAFSGLSREKAVILHFNYLFERDPSFDSNGNNYWVNGAGAAIPTDDLVLALLLGVQGEDKQTLSNKIYVADYISDNEPGLASPAGVEILGTVTSDPNSVADALQQVDLFV